MLYLEISDDQFSLKLTRAYRLFTIDFQRIDINKKRVHIWIPFYSNSNT